MNALFDQMPEDTVMCPDAGRPPQDVLGRTSTTSPEGRRRDPGLEPDPAGRAAGARPDRQRTSSTAARWRSTCAAATWPSSMRAACSSST